jgi:hypothetical protein
MKKNKIQGFMLTHLMQCGIVFCTPKLGAVLFRR